MKTYTKRAPAVLDYLVDWDTWLAADESINTSTWMVASGLTQPIPPALTQRTTTVWLGSGVVGQSYVVTNRIMTTQGRTDERSFTIYITAT